MKFCLHVVDWVEAAAVAMWKQRWGPQEGTHSDKQMEELQLAARWGQSWLPVRVCLIPSICFCAAENLSKFSTASQKRPAWEKFGFVGLPHICQFQH